MVEWEVSISTMQGVIHLALISVILAFILKMTLHVMT